MSDDEIIKNKNRGLSKKETEPYVPEYIKLRKSPIIMGIEGQSADYSSMDLNYIDPKTMEEKPVTSGFIDNNELISGASSDIENDQNVAINDYILLVHDNIVCKGSKSLIEKTIQHILYGEHPDFKNEVKPEEIILLKRVDIKYGVFIKE